MAADGVRCSTSPECSFSYDGLDWLEGGDEGPTGPLAHEPGWDFFVVPIKTSKGPTFIRVRRSLPIRLVRVYGEWPSSDSALATVLHPGGVKEAEVSLPKSAAKLQRLLVAVCPPAMAASCQGAQDETETIGVPRLGRLSGNAYSAIGAAAVAAAEAEAQAAELEKRAAEACRRPYLSSYLRRQGSISPSSSDLSTCSSAQHVATRSSSSTPRGLTTSAILCQLYEEEVLTAFAAGESCGDEGLDSLSGSRQKNAEIDRLRKELEKERLARQAAEANAEQAVDRARALHQECSLLQQRLRSAERRTMALEMQGRQLSTDLQRAELAACTNWAPAKSLEDVVSQLVTLEIRQLQNLTADERASVKRRLLLRWHPDKNAGTGGGNDLAKRVLQEMQAHPSWG
ncbi:unnamed protein product [Symbiodinium pilosum]|uniref:J domain-containing protein n=1 Tax=Symbiodinium pilosum TaxID=2952 RepID=A0A812WUK2_SYMPI|nr:unnamed protein product [Symbiodinium pilosum]